MSTTIYLVRHAEAEGNLGRRCHGHYDSMLTPPRLGAGGSCRQALCRYLFGRGVFQ